MSETVKLESSLLLRDWSAESAHTPPGNNESLLAGNSLSMNCFLSWMPFSWRTSLSRSLTRFASCPSMINDEKLCVNSLAPGVDGLDMDQVLSPSQFMVAAAGLSRSSWSVCEMSARTPLSTTLYVDQTPRP